MIAIGSSKSLQTILQFVRDSLLRLRAWVSKRRPAPPNMPEYRLGVIDRYLKIHELFENQAEVNHPGPRDRLEPVPKAQDRDDIYAVADAYLGLLEQPVPSATGTFWTGVKWRDSQGPPIYFATQQEAAAVRNALSLQAIDDQREPIRRRLLNLADLTLGAVQFLPGASIP